MPIISPLLCRMFEPFIKSNARKFASGLARVWSVVSDSEQRITGKDIRKFERH